MTMSRVRRRTARSISVLLGSALILASCGSDDDGGAVVTDTAVSGTEATGTAAPSVATSDAAAAAFPVTIDTAYGEITVDQQPERIVALAGRHIELLSLLEEQPVAFTDYGADDEQLRTSYPWMEGTYEGEADPSLFTADYAPAVEAIAALEPDLILTTIWQVDEPMYEQLSQIAPTYVGIEAETNTSWQDDLGAIASLTGHDPVIVEETEAQLATAISEAADRVPGLQDKTFFVAALGADDQLWLTEYGTEPVLGLGLQPGPGQPVTGADAADAPKFSRENIDQLTADVVFVAANRDLSGEFLAGLEADPRLAELPASKNGTLFLLAPPQWNAINGGSAMSTLWWLEQVLPQLEASALNQSGQ